MAAVSTDSSAQPPAAAVDNKTIADFDPPKKPKRNKYAMACAMLASMTSILLGYGEFFFFFLLCIA